MSFLQNRQFVPKVDASMHSSLETINYWAFSSRQLFKSQLILGLVAWRNGENPCPQMEKAVDRALTSIAELSKLNPQAVLEVDFLLENLKTVAFLVDKSPTIEINWHLIEAPDRRLDCMLASALHTNILPDAQIDTETSKLLKSKKTTLAAKTYQAYFDLLRADKSDNIASKVKEAEALYLDRASDSFYSGGEKAEGGGLDNGSVVDYRLASILKKINYPGSSVHRWNW